MCDRNFGLNPYRVGTNWNCDVFKVKGNEYDAKINIIPVGDLAEGLYMIQLANYPSYYLTAGDTVEGGQVYWADGPDSVNQMWRFEEQEWDDSPIPSEYEISCPLDSYYSITQYYKPTEEVNDNIDGDSFLDNQHLGIDYGAAQGTPIKAAADGEVIYIQSWKPEDGINGWASMGNAVYIKHTDGMTLYMHMSNNPSNYVSKGQRVHKGDTIGYVGSTGNSGGNHLHFGYKIDGNFPYDNVEAYNYGTWVNPDDYMMYN